LPDLTISTLKEYKLSVCFIILFCLALSFLAYSSNDFQKNIAPKYMYIAKARNFIFLANASYTAEEKAFCLNESLYEYQSGSNLVKIKALMPYSDSSQITEVYNSLSSEYNGYLYPSTRLKLWLFEALFLCFSIVGMSVPIIWWKSQKRKIAWSAITIFLLFTVFILFV